MAKRKKKPQNRVLYVRNLSKETIEALKWAQEHFDVGSNSQAAINLIERYKELYDEYESLIVYTGEIDRKLQSITTLVEERFRLDKRIEDYISKIELKF